MASVEPDPASGERWKISESLVPLKTPIGDLHGLPGNPRRGELAAIKRSLKRFGQRKPVVARRGDGMLEAGNHTVLAALELDWTHVAVSWEDDDDATAKGFALADNQTAALGRFDQAKLQAMVAEVEAADPALLEAASFDQAKPERAANTASQLGELEYRVIVRAKDEAHQAELLERFQAEGLDCQAVIV